MVLEILQGIREDKYTDMRQVMSDFGFSNYLLKTVFQGMVKKGLLQNIEADTSQESNIHNDDKLCRGFNSYWKLTDKGKNFIENKKTFS